MVQITRNGRKVLQLSRLFKQRLSLLCISPAPLFFFVIYLKGRMTEQGTHTHTCTHIGNGSRDILISSHSPSGRNILGWASRSQEAGSQEVCPLCLCIWQGARSEAEKPVLGPRHTSMMRKVLVSQAGV